jgi:F1F0 ATPase subunit 2
MTISVYSLLSFFIGLVLGLLYFTGLWLTIKNMYKSRSPIVTSLLSFTLRTAAIFLVLIFVARQGSFIDIIILLIGFIVGRFILSRRIGHPKQTLKP